MLSLRRCTIAAVVAALPVVPLQAQAAPSDADRAAVATLSSDLRNLVTTQEGWYAQHSAYALSVAELGGVYRTSAGVTVELANATAEPRTVELVQAVLGESQRMSNASARWAMKDGAPTFTLVVPPNARQAVTYKVTYIND